MKFGNIVMVTMRDGDFPGVVVEENTTKSEKPKVLFVGGDLEEVSKDNITALDEPGSGLRHDLLTEYLVLRADQEEK